MQNNCTIFSLSARFFTLCVGKKGGENKVNTIVLQSVSFVEVRTKELFFDDAQSSCARQKVKGVGEGKERKEIKFK